MMPWVNREQRRRKKALYAHALTVARDGDVDAVIDLLDSPNYLVRTEAIKAIRRRRLSAAAPRLADAVENDPDVKLGALLALEKLALPESGPTFKRSLEDPELSPVALRGLLAIRDPEAVSAAEAVYHQGGFLARSVALYVLSCAGIQRSQDAFRRLLEAEPSWWSRWRIRKAIWQACRNAALDRSTE